MSGHLIVFTSMLIWKLGDIGKCLRDCSEDILNIAKTFSERLVAAGKTELTPEDFALEWNGMISKMEKDLLKDLNDNAVCLDDGVHYPPGFLEGIRPRLARIDAGKLMPWFAEDLCGKEFAAEVLKLDRPEPKAATKAMSFEEWQKQPSAKKIIIVPPDSLEQDDAERMAELDQEAEDDRASGKSATFFPFTHEKPVMEQEAEQRPHRFAHQFRPYDGPMGIFEGFGEVPESEPIPDPPGTNVNAPHMSLGDRTATPSSCEKLHKLIEEPKLWVNDSDRLSDVEHFPPPPGNEFHNDCWDA